jgi:hypothetical protein
MHHGNGYITIEELLENKQQRNRGNDVFYAVHAEAI